jgi:hypothetical protein
MLRGLYANEKTESSNNLKNKLPNLKEIAREESSAIKSLSD